MIWFLFFRTEFILDENGDVSWEVPDAAEALPFFNCETYEVNIRITLIVEYNQILITQPLHPIDCLSLKNVTFDIFPSSKAIGCLFVYSLIRNG